MLVDIAIVYAILTVASGGVSVPALSGDSPVPPDVFYMREMSKRLLLCFLRDCYVPAYPTKEERKNRFLFCGDQLQ